MRVSITGFMRNMLRPGCAEQVAEFLGNLKELRDAPSKHAEFFDLYVFGDDTEYRKRAAQPAEPAPSAITRQVIMDAIAQADGVAGGPGYASSSQIADAILAVVRSQQQERGRT